ncbi:MAG: YfhO family protein [Candidatus Hydrothermales bacterium]
MAGSDYLLGGYASREWLSLWLKKFYFPLWYPDERLGYPLLEEFWMDIFTPTGLLRLLLPTHIHFNLSFFIYTLLAGFGTYLFLRELKIKPIFAFIAGVFYSFSGALITNTSAGHLNRLVSSSLLPYVLFFLLLGVNKKKFFFFILAGFFSGWQFLGGHFQFNYFSFFIYIPFFFFLLFSNPLSVKEKIKLTIYAAFGLFLTLMLFSVYFLPLFKSLKFVARGIERGYEYSASWPLFPLESLDMIFINFSGFFDTYWGPNLFRLNHYYIGFFPFVFFILSLFSKNKKTVLFFFILFLITLTFAWGKYFLTHKIFYNVLPGISKFRGPSNIFFLCTFSFVTLSAFGLTYFFENFDDKKIKITLFTFLTLFILLLLLLSPVKDFLRDVVRKISENPKELNEKLFALDKVIPLFRNNLIFLIFEIIIVYFIFFLFKVKIEKEFLFLLFPIITIFEALIFLRPKFLKSMDIKDYLKSDEVIDFLKKREGEFRVFYFPNFYEHDNDGILSIYGIEDVGGYVASPIQRYQDFIGSGQSVMFNPQNLIKNRNLLNLLNVKYLIFPTFPMDTLKVKDNVKKIVKFLLEYTRNMDLVLKGDRYYIFENKNDFGRFFVRGKIYVAETDNEALTFTVKESIFDTFAIVEKKFLNDELKNFGSASPQIEELKIIEKKPGYYKIKIRLNQKGILVFSMNYHNAWNVFVDGKQGTVFPVNYTLTGTIVPEGEHEIIFRFGSPFHYGGIFITLLGYFIFLCLLALFVFKR